MNFPAFDFPPGPGHEFRGAPVYLEPMMGSGERLAIAAAVTGQSMYAVEGLVRPETAECLYGAKAPAFLGLVEAITRSLASSRRSPDRCAITSSTTARCQSGPRP